MAIMSKLLKLRPFKLQSALQKQVKYQTETWIILTVCFSFLQSHSHGVPTPTNAAEAQILMNAMREDALARVGIDVNMQK